MLVFSPKEVKEASESKDKLKELVKDIKQQMQDKINSSS
jgi:hypothetical protein